MLIQNMVNVAVALPLLVVTGYARRPSNAFIAHKRPSHTASVNGMGQRSSPPAPTVMLWGSGDSGENQENINMNELQRRIDKQLNQYYELLLNQEEDDAPRPEDVHIIVFNPGSEGEQGVHTIEFPKGSGLNIILAFESGDECIEFAKGLKNMQFYDPVPQQTNLVQLEEFCKALGVPVKVVPEGKDLRPPSDNVEDLSHNPNLGKEKSRLEDLLKDDGAQQQPDNNDDELGSWE